MLDVRIHRRLLHRIGEFQGLRPNDCKRRARQIRRLRRSPGQVRRNSCFPTHDPEGFLP
uniref:Uncharacterized protein n=1 Tax=Arundo donax TaxID=35708 RepID=A0A0A8Z698_ARUDO